MSKPAKKTRIPYWARFQCIYVYGLRCYLLTLLAAFSEGDRLHRILQFLAVLTLSTAVASPVTQANEDIETPATQGLGHSAKRRHLTENPESY